MNEDGVDDATSDVWRLVMIILGCALVIAVSVVGYSMATRRPETPAASNLQTDASVAAVVQYEYITLTPPDPVYESTINRLGGEGWELASQRRARGRLDDMCYEVTFKRQKRDGQRATTSDAEDLRALNEYRALLKRQMDQERAATETAAAAEKQRAAAEAAAKVAVTETAGPAKPPPSEEERERQIKEWSKAIDDRRVGEYYIDDVNGLYHAQTCPLANPKTMLLAVKQAATMKGYKPHDCVRPRGQR